jgi:hypothetical protein
MSVRVKEIDGVERAVVCDAEHLDALRLEMRS